FYVSGTHDLVDVADCWLAETDVAAAFQSIRERAKAPGAAAEERIEVARRADGTIDLNLAPGEASAGRFAQVNSRQNNALIDVVRSAVEGRHFSKIIDLYCGSGNLTFPLAEAIDQVEVFGVELSGHLIRLAQAASESLGD